ncbi:hypothetical protein ADK65_06940 [Streptomyces sp. NRRL B-1140]|uniref:hypothetical protein n=1 Tax=Streptomyces sp. NRRL B-1140 TaxID=1415549 RepID=UPI0006AFA1C9|nr:hypothetical protein [Streptomyces sp. NRRL B-1140]KOX03295.1 hypothetical protein ADK65_06940 [Streptomyces sp. NRRL B-1140]
MDYDSVADELYALRPEEFTAARASAMAAARTAGDRELAERIRALRKPSLAAWVSNLLVRSSPDEVAPLLRLGEGLRRAHQDLDGAQLRELSRRQHALIRALSLQARQLAKEAGHPIGESVQREVENTLHAVLADPEAARAWAGGRLAKPLSAAVGFPAVAEGARPQRPARAPGPAPSRPEGKAGEQRRRRLDRAREEAEAAERALRELRGEAEAAGRAAAEARGRVDGLQQRVEELTGELERARKEHQQARFAERAAREEARAADRRAREAGRKAATAAAHLERLASPDA